MKFGFLELVVIFVVALIVLGPDKLPTYAKKLGESLKVFKSYSGKLAEEINENVMSPLAEVAEPLQKVAKDISEPFADVKKTIEGIGKAPSQNASVATSNKDETTLEENKTEMNAEQSNVEHTEFVEVIPDEMDTE